MAILTSSKKTILLVFILLATISFPCSALSSDYQVIKNIKDLGVYSQYDEKTSFRTLLPGEYLIPDDASLINLYQISEKLSLGTSDYTSLIIGKDGGKIVDPLIVTEELVIDEFGDLTVYGNSSSYPTLLLVAVNQNGGELKAYGHFGDGASSTYALDTDIYVLTSGSIYAVGGQNDFAIGLHTADLLQEGGSITASGGRQGDGIYCTGRFVQASGTTKTTGGSYFGAYGIYSNGFILYSGEFASIGGEGSRSPGLRVSGQLIQAGGAIIAKGNDDGGSEGIWVITQLVTLDGSIEAIGGSHSGVNGITIDQDLIHLKGNIALQGGAAQTAYGMYVGKKAYIDSIIILTTKGSAPNLYVANQTTSTGITFSTEPIVSINQEIFSQNDAITFRKNSKIVVEIDSNPKNSALIEVGRQGVYVEQGTQLEVSFKSLELKENELVEISLIKLNNGKFSTSELFEIINPEPLSYDIHLKLNEEGNQLILVVKKL